VVPGFAFGFFVIYVSRIFFAPFAHPLGHPSQTLSILDDHFVKRLCRLYRAFVGRDLTYRLQTKDSRPKSLSQHMPLTSALAPAPAGASIPISAPTLARTLTTTLPSAAITTLTIAATLAATAALAPAATPTLATLPTFLFRRGNIRRSEQH
jgi:hypothetical protein